MGLLGALAVRPLVVITALGWGGVAALSLVLGAALALVRPWPDRLVGVVLGFGAGALISSVAFELAEEGLRVGSALAVALGLAAGAVTFFLADRGVQRLGGRGGGDSAGTPLALGALLDGIPEQAVLGVGLAQGGSVSLALLVAIFVSNLPEAIGSSSDMVAAASTGGSCSASGPSWRWYARWRPARASSPPTSPRRTSRPGSTGSRPVRCW